MKKLLVVLAALALIVGVDALKAEAAETGPISVTVTVQYIAVTVTDGTIAFATVVPNTHIVAGEKQVVTNGGNVDETYTLRLTTTDVYIVGETETGTGANTFVLQALFTGSGGTAPVSANFGADATDADDVVKASGTQTASATVYAWTGGTGTGAAVPAAGIRDLYLKYSSPTSVTTGAQEDLVVTLTAAAS